MILPLADPPRSRARPARPEQCYHDAPEAEEAMMPYKVVSTRAVSEDDSWKIEEELNKQEAEGWQFVAAPVVTRSTRDVVFLILKK
jgi:hypothetical protein